MPLYEYQCLPNHHRFEVRHAVTESPVTACPECGEPVRRVIHPAGIVFKGSGFYATDSRSKGSKPVESKSGEAKSTDTPKTESGTSETKTETKSEKAAS